MKQKPKLLPKQKEKKVKTPANTLFAEREREYLSQHIRKKQKIFIIGHPLTGN
ncbi:MAG: hypothetical protein L3J74_16195 [Bacteroidales bacterium]|nr:hypothetical protein [Bacteroidales bacterium]